jgi:hypothetical protein
MESLVKHYIQEAKEGIEIDGEIINLLNKKESETILKKNGITNQIFAHLTKMVMDYYTKEIAGKKAGPLINNDEIKAKFPEIKYVQEITVRSYLCHALETSKDIFDNAISDNENLKKEAIKDLTINLAVVQLKKIYKITSLKFAKILNKQKEAITSTEVKTAKAELERQIKLDISDVIPDEIKSIMIDKGEKINSQNILDIKNEIKKIDVIIDETAIRNVNKYLSAIKETFDFLILHFKGISVKNLDKSKKILQDAYNKKDLVFIDKIQTTLKTLGNINSYAMKEDFEEMNILAWCGNVLNLKAYHTSVSDFDPISNELEKKVVSILNRYKPAQRNSYDAYHLVEDFIEICRDQTGEIKLSHQISDLMLIEVLKDFMKKTNDLVNTLSQVSNKINKVGIVDVNRDESGNVTSINNDKTDRQRRLEVEKMVADQFKTTAKARKFFLDIYNGLTTFNGKTWNSLSQDIQNGLLKAAKIDKSSSEYLDIKLNRRIEKNTGISPITRENQLADDLKKNKKEENHKSMSDNALKFIKNFKANKENYRDKYKSKIDLMQQVVDSYESNGKISKTIKDIFDKDEEFKYKIITFALAIPANGNIRNLLLESSESTPLLNKYIGLINENK